MTAPLRSPPCHQYVEREGIVEYTHRRLEVDAMIPEVSYRFLAIPGELRHCGNLYGIPVSVALPSRHIRVLAERPAFSLIGLEQGDDRLQRGPFVRAFHAAGGFFGSRATCELRQSTIVVDSGRRPLELTAVPVLGQATSIPAGLDTTVA